MVLKRKNIMQFVLKSMEISSDTAGISPDTEESAVSGGDSSKRNLQRTENAKKRFSLFSDAGRRGCC